MGGEQDAVEVLRAALERQPALDALGDGGATRADVQAALDVSRSTAHRVLKELESLELAAQRDGEYELTPFGRVVARESAHATTTVEVASRLSPLLETFQDAGEAIELDRFGDASVTTPEPGDPYRPMRRLLQLVEDATGIAEFAPTMPEPAYLRTLYDRVRGDLDADVLYPASVVDRLERENEAALASAVEDGDLSLRVDDLPDYRLIVADDHVYLGSYNEDTSHVRVVADTDGADAVDWATERFRARWESATPYDVYRSEG